MIYNATFVDSDSQTNSAENMLEYLKYANQKVNKLPVTDWFKATFQELDKAIFEDKMTLVHCQSGASRSPAFVAAYLVNRFHFTAEEAVVFLMKQRNKVNISHFLAPLKEYQKALFAARNLAAAAEGKKLPHPPKTAEVVSGDKTEMQEDKTE